MTGEGTATRTLPVSLFSPFESPADPAFVLALSFDALCVHTVRCTAEKSHGARVHTYAQPDEVRIWAFLTSTVGGG